jgi:hypothetical protein
MHHHFEPEMMSLEIRHAYMVFSLLSAYVVWLLLVWFVSV